MRNMKHFKRLVFKKYKGFPIVLFIAVSLMMVVSAGFIGYYTSIEADVTVNSLLTYNDSPAEDFLIERDISGVPGNSFNFDGWLNVSQYAQPDTVLQVSIVNDSEILCTISIDGVEYEHGDTFFIQPNDELQINETYTIMLNATSGSYSSVFMITPQSP